VYKLELDLEELRMHVNGLDAQVRLLCQQIAQSQSAGQALKNVLPQLLKIDQQFDKMQQVMEAKEVLEKTSVAKGE
jgi:hypothetical protein